MASAQPLTFAQLLKHHRIAAGLTQEMLAERAGLASRSVSDLERGLRHSPYADTINKLADALLLSAEERAQFEGAARRRRVPSAPRAPDVPDGGPHLSPVTPAEGTSPPAPALGMGVRAGLLASEQVAQEAPLSPQRGRDTLLTRLMTVLLVGTLLASTLISAGAVRPQLPPPSGGTLCLATDLPTTGDVGPWGMSLEHAVQLAVQQNQNLGNGYRLEVITYNEASTATGQPDPQQGAHDVTDMVQTPCIVGMIGPFNSSVAPAEMPIAANAGLVMISPANTMPGLTMRLYAGDYGLDFDQLHPAGKQTNYFRNIAHDAFQGLELADFASRQPPAGLGARNAFVLQDHTPYGEELAGGFTQEFLAHGGAIVGTDGVPFGGAARTAELASRIVTTRPDVVVYGGTTDNGGGLLQAQLVRAGYRGLLVGGDGIAEDPVFVDQAGATANNNVFAINPVPDPLNLTSSAAARFIHDYHARYPGQDLDGYGANAYDAAMLMITAIKHLIRTGQEVTRQAALEQVQTIQYAGITGPISFDHNGDITHGVFSLYTVQNGKWVWVKQTSV